MNYTIYEYSLFIALPLMLFFGFYFLLAKIPEKVIFSNYLRSRRIMGIALRCLPPIIRCISFSESGLRTPMRPF